MSIQLLDKTRKLNKLLQKSGDVRVDFKDIAMVMSDILASNVLIVSKKGKLLAVHELAHIEKIEELLTDQVGECIDCELNDRILNILSTKENFDFRTLGFFEEGNDRDVVGLLIPINIAGKRSGSIIIYRNSKDYTIDDIILGEYGATVVGLELMSSIHEENSQEERKILVVKSAISTLSFSEQEAIKHIFNELGCDKGIIVASKVADKAGITRSVIVNALRKFESAGVIETRSLGMKGTYIKVLNELLIDEVKG